jgi:MoaA/NifB/PqqE/SkfB family radical SAM enzyme
MDVSTNGNVFLCVKGWLKDENTAYVGNLQIKDGLEIWHGEKAKEFRDSILDGSYKFCCEQKCPWLNSPDEHGSPMEDEPPTVRNKPEIVNAAYDMTCNLYCVSCRKDIIVDMNFQRHDVLKKRIQDMGDIGEIIMIGSGDPFSSPHVRAWLKSEDVAAKKIMFHTNGTLLTKERWDSLPEDIRKKTKKIEVSIDAASKKTYEDVRRGFSWEILQENLRFISSLRSSGQLEYLKFSFVVYRPNYHEMPDFVRMCLDLNADDIFFNRAEDWAAFGCEYTELFQVHLPAHKEHSKLQDVLEDPVLQNPKVRLGNLRRYVRAKNVSDSKE